ncbi:MAG TPA: hypothetical protein VND88_04090 [Candidatus Acidoferrales bacterium]|nr:hypothetical protein [Candidatus Acidoferrales bacterium]
MSLAAARVVTAARNRTLTALDEATLTTLVVVSEAVDRQPGNAALVAQWRALVADLRIEAPGRPQRDVAALLADFRADVNPSRSIHVIEGHADAV